MVWFTVTQAKTTLVGHIPTTINEDPTHTLLGEPNHFLIASEFNPVRTYMAIDQIQTSGHRWRCKFKKRFAHPSRDSGIALAVAGTPAEAGEDDDEGDDVEDGGDDGEDQLHLQEGERQPHLYRDLFITETTHKIFLIFRPSEFCCLFEDS
jgi:hypothetical protein